MTPRVKPEYVGTEEVHMTLLVTVPEFTICITRVTLCLLLTSLSVVFEGSDLRHMPTSIIPLFCFLQLPTIHICLPRGELPVL